MIVVLSLTTAHELIVALPRLRPGEVHRASRAIERIGGKGVNVARFCGAMGVPVRLVAIADGPGADELRTDPDLAAADLRIVATDVRARTDVIVAEASGRASVLNGSAPGPGPSVVQDACEALLADLATGDLVVLTGSLPPSAPVDLYATLIEEVRARGARSLLDTSGAWLRAALSAAPDVCKVSAEELATARDAARATAWSDGPSLAPEPAALIVTAGPRGARLWQGDRRWTVQAPRQVPVDPIGAGDATMAGLCAGLAQGLSLELALAQGVGWAAAKVRELDLVIDPTTARALTDAVRVVSRSAAAGRGSPRAPAPRT